VLSVGSECAECGEFVLSVGSECVLSVGRRLTNSRTRQLEETWCVVYPHLTDTFFHPSLLVVAFVDKSGRVLVPPSPYSSVICSSSRRLCNYIRSSSWRRGPVCCSSVTPNSCILLRTLMRPGLSLSFRKPCRFDLPAENDDDG